MKGTIKGIALVSSCFAFLFGIAGDVAAKGISLKNNDTYTITINKDNPRLLKVKAELILKDDVLYMSRNGAGQFPERWAKFVHNIKAVDKRLRVLKITDLGEARWKIDAGKGLRVRLTYEVVLDHEKHKWSGGIDGAAFAKDWGVFYTGRSFLIMNGQESKDIGLKFDIPADWSVSGSWDQLGPKRFVAANLTDLSESMFFAGTHREFSVKRNGFELLFALGGKEIVAQEDKFRSLSQGVMDYYIELMGGIPKSPPGNEFKKSIVIINSGSEMDGEVIGSHINMIFNPDGDAQSKIISKFIFAHEFFHLWNGKSIVVENTTEDWFKEGVTSYYTLKALRSVGEINDDAYFAILNNLFYQRYSNDKGFGKLSMRDVAEGFSKGEHWGLIYGGGLFVGLCQDIAIRTHTSNGKSLDDLMRNYYRNYAGTSKTYSTSDMQNSMTGISGVNQSTFFQKHVFGITPVPVTHCLSGAGLKATVEEGQLKITKKQDTTTQQKEILKGILGAD
jgi:predicted metalloprotease with PDZ domain